MRVRWHLNSIPQSIEAPRTERIFVASTHWNNELILRSHWIPAVLDLTRHFGADNIFISVVESGSWDNSKDALRELDLELEKAAIQRKIVLNDTTHADEISSPAIGEGWIKTPRGKIELRRIPYLSRMRNLSLQPLVELAEAGMRFDKILFLNDVVFDTEDVQSLLRTNGGQYAAACSLDFSRPPSIYDTFALRDIDGHEQLMSTWPYFRAAASREAVKTGNPVPVTSCWNGMVVMDAAPFYGTRNPLRFRGVPDSLAELHVEGSECCLVHVDNPLSPATGVWINPRVRVGYSSTAYQQVQSQDYEQWLSPIRIFCKLWENRIKRWFTSPWFKEWVVRRRVTAWSSDTLARAEHGLFCLINEMQVIVPNGWAHV